jgi:hypothetical protein
MDPQEEKIEIRGDRNERDISALIRRDAAKLKHKEFKIEP